MVDNTTEYVKFKLFGGTASEYSYIQEVVTLHVARLIMEIYKCDALDFERACKSKEGFYDFVVEAIEPSEMKPFK